MAGIYIHIPFCRQACHYCDFHFSTNLSYKNQMVMALVEELNLQRHYLENYELETIYFGGGTPSLLNEAELSLILDKIREIYHVKDNAEITLEANPDDLSYENLKIFHQSGINRLSIGIQSFSDKVLKYLNRIHSSKDALNCVIDARKIGFKDISIDIIYGIPPTIQENWESELSNIAELAPEHISAYCLTIEPQTAFGAWMKKGKIKPVDDDYAANQFEYLLDFLQKQGYEQYEISNFSLPGKYSKHNTNYWRQEKYLGIGPGAHSYNRKSRQFNINNNIKYIKSIENGIVPFELDILSDEDRINEYIMTSLRTRWGCNFNKVKNEFDVDLVDLNKIYIDDLLAKNFARFEENTLILTLKGKLLADKITSDLFLTSKSS